MPYIPLTKGGFLAHNIYFLQIYFQEIVNDRSYSNPKSSTNISSLATQIRNHKSHDRKLTLWCPQEPHSATCSSNKTEIVDVCTRQNDRSNQLSFQAITANVYQVYFKLWLSNLNTKQGFI